MNIVSDLPCERCGARVPWDGRAPGVTCPYCQATTRAPAFGARSPQIAAAPRSGGGAGVIIAAVVGLVLVVLVGGVVAMLALRPRSTGSPSTIGPTAVGISAKKTKPSSTASAAPGADLAKLVFSFGEEGNGPGQTDDARSIGVDMDENVYLADYSTARVQKFDATGKFQWIVEVPKNSFSGDKNIWSLVCDTKGTLWVARTGDLLQYATADGKPKGTIKGNYDTSWFHLLAIDPVGNMVAEHTTAGDTTILFMDPKGKVKQRVKRDETQGLAIDGAGNVYIDAMWDGTIEVLDPKGATKAKFGSKKDKHTRSPGALAVDGKGHVFVETSEGINAFDSGGAYIGTLPGVHSARDIEVSVKNDIFVLDNRGKVHKYEPGPKLR
jgi:streptogramin lyase